MTEKPYDPDTHGERRLSLEEPMMVLLRHFQALMDKRVGAVEDRLATLTDSITSWMDKHSYEVPCKYLKEAVPDEDYEEHGAYHKGKRRLSRWVGRTSSSVGAKMIEYITLFVTGWLAIAVWEYFKQGVK